MPRFVRWILFIVCIFAAAMLVVNATAHFANNKSREEELRHQRDQLTSFFTRASGRSRHAEIVMAGHETDAFGRVSKTSLYWREYAIDVGAGEKPLAIQKFTITGDAPRIDADVLEFSAKYPEPILAGKTIGTFRRMVGGTGNGGAGDQELPLAVDSEVPPAFEVGAHYVSQLQRELWASLWDLLRTWDASRNDAEIYKSRRVKVTRYSKSTNALETGKIYKLILRAETGLEVQERYDTEAVRKFIDEATASPAGSADSGK